MVKGCDFSKYPPNIAINLKSISWYSGWSLKLSPHSVSVACNHNHLIQLLSSILHSFRFYRSVPPVGGRLYCAAPTALMCSSQHSNFCLSGAFMWITSFACVMHNPRCSIYSQGTSKSTYCSLFLNLSLTTFILGFAKSFGQFISLMYYNLLPGCPLCRASSYFSVGGGQSRQARNFYVWWCTWKSPYDTLCRHCIAVLNERMEGLHDHYNWLLRLDLYHGRHISWFAQLKHYGTLEVFFLLRHLRWGPLQNITTAELKGSS